MSRITLVRRLSPWFGVPAVALLLLVGAPRAALAVDPVAPVVAPVPLDKAKLDLDVFLKQIKLHTPSVEDLGGSIGSISTDFFNIALPVKPAEAAADATDDQKKQAAADLAAYDKATAEYPKAVLTWQGDALDALFKALASAVVVGGDNARTEVNMKAANALGELVASAELGKQKNDIVIREPAAVGKLRAARSREMIDVIGKDLAEKKRFAVATGVLDAAYGCLGKWNEPASLDYLLKEYAHTNNGTFMEERLVAAHKAMVLFTNVPGKMRYAIVDQFLRVYPSTEATASQSKNDPAVQAAKKFWDRVKTTAVEVVSYYSIDPSTKLAPQNKDGQKLTSMKDLRDWFSDHEKVNKAPWLDPK